jgi:replicative DNA helicase
MIKTGPEGLFLLAERGEDTLNDYDKDQVRGRINEYLASRGHREIIEPKGGPCPVCGQGQHTPNTHLKDNRIKCFACGWHGDIFDLIGQLEGIQDQQGQFLRAAEIFNLETGAETPQTRAKPPKAVQKKSPVDFTDFYRRCQANAGPAVSYLTGRGISLEVIGAHGIGYDPIKKAAVIPITSLYYVSRSIEGKTFHNPPGAPIAIDAATLDQPQPVFIVEGEIDALSVETAGGHAIALHSTANTHKLIEAVKHLQTTPALILSLDNDEAGQKAQAELAAELEALNIVCLQANISGDQKDANDRLRADLDGLRDAILEALEQAAIIQQSAADQAEADLRRELEKYKSNSTASYLDDFTELVKKKANRPAISTGYHQLDRVLDGGLFESLYILGAISSLGKTTFMLQMADSIAASGHDVLLFSLEMSRFELAGKSISRQTFILDDTKGKTRAKTTRGIINGSLYQYYRPDETELIRNAAAAYRLAAGHIYIIEAAGNVGAAEIRAAVADHKRITGNAPVIVVDYLQIIKARDTHASDKQNTDFNVSELKRISRDYEIPILAVSSLNRDNYTSPINEAAFKESGAIEYSSDVLMGLQVKGADDYGTGEASRGKNHKDTEAKKKQDPREIELKILKNRNGRAGEKILFNYYPKFNYFIESTDEFLNP